MLRRTLPIPCEFNGGLCDDPRCSKTHCAGKERETREVERLAAERQSVEVQLLSEHAERTVRDWLQARRIKITPQRIAKLIGQPRVQEEARRRLAFVQAFSKMRGAYRPAETS